MLTTEPFFTTLLVLRPNSIFTLPELVAARGLFVFAAYCVENTVETTSRMVKNDFLLRISIV
jgi:hypothetical protein